MLLKYDFLIDDEKISWNHLKTFYEHDKKYPVRAAPKLTSTHLKPNSFEKMKTKYATQIFSTTVASSMNVSIRFGHLPADAYKTAEFVSKMDNFFDLLNSSSNYASKKFNKPFKNLPVLNVLELL